MGKKCSVKGCKTGYESQKNQPKIPIYSFPNDSEEKGKWAESFPYEINKITKFMGICAIHFPPDVSVKHWSNFRIPLEPPSIFPKQIKSPTPRKKPQEIKEFETESNVTRSKRDVIKETHNRNIHGDEGTNFKYGSTSVQNTPKFIPEKARDGELDL